MKMRTQFWEDSMVLKCWKWRNEGCTNNEALSSEFLISTARQWSQEWNFLYFSIAYSLLCAAGLDACCALWVSLNLRKNLKNLLISIGHGIRETMYLTFGLNISETLHHNACFISYSAFALVVSFHYSNH